jgi:hypothetical protein
MPGDRSSDPRNNPEMPSFVLVFAAPRAMFVAMPRVLLVLVLVTFTACAGGDGPPPPGGGFGAIGASCFAAYDCASGFCCKSPPCRGGMCTYACRDDFDCPPGARCDGGACFWACLRDTDCAIGQSCKKQHSVCQY